jgi:hypothetical protein
MTLVEDMSSAEINVSDSALNIFIHPPSSRLASMLVSTEEPDCIPAALE